MKPHRDECDSHSVRDALGDHAKVDQETHDDRKGEEAKRASNHRLSKGGIGVQQSDRKLVAEDCSKYCAIGSENGELHCSTTKGSTVQSVKEKMMLVRL